MFLSPPDGGPEEGDLGLEEGEAGASGTETTKELSEKFLTGIKSDQAALKQLYKEEKQAKKKDHSIAKSIAKFLQDDRYFHLALLVARLVALNTPTPFILALLALIDKESHENLYEKMKEVKIKPADHGTLEIQLEEKKLLGNKLTEKAKKELDAWIYHIYQISTLKPHKLLDAVVNKKGEVNLSLTQLGSFVIQEFLQNNEAEIDFKSVNAFITLLITKILTAIKKTVVDQKTIEGKTEDEAEDEQ